VDQGLSHQVAFRIKNSVLWLPKCTLTLRFNTMNLLPISSQPEPEEKTIEV